MGDIVKLLKIGTQHYNFLKSNDMIAKVSKHWGYIKKVSPYTFFIYGLSQFMN
jgi:formate-dependent phosphoribosylglycinamide formyltransferase (GAR transformylase)